VQLALHAADEDVLAHGGAADGLLVEVRQRELRHRRGLVLLGDADGVLLPEAADLPLRLLDDADVEVEDRVPPADSLLHQKPDRLPPVPRELGGQIGTTQLVELGATPEAVIV
jgi:hypothetical protein